MAATEGAMRYHLRRQAPRAAACAEVEHGDEARVHPARAPVARRARRAPAPTLNASCPSPHPHAIHEQEASLERRVSYDRLDVARIGRWHAHDGGQAAEARGWPGNPGEAPDGRPDVEDIL